MYISEQKESNCKLLRRKRNEDMNGNRKLFWKEVSNAKGGKVQSGRRIKAGNRRLAEGEDEV